MDMDLKTATQDYVSAANAYMSFAMGEVDDSGFLDEVANAANTAKWQLKQVERDAQPAVAFACGDHIPPKRESERRIEPTTKGILEICVTYLDAAANGDDLLPQHARRIHRAARALDEVMYEMEYKDELRDSEA